MPAKQKSDGIVTRSDDVSDFSEPEALQFQPVQLRAVGVVQKFKVLASYRVTRVSDWLAVNFASEFERGLAFNLLPMFLAIGIAIYFSVHTEPILAIVILSAAGLASFVFAMKVHGKAFYVLSAFATIIVGMSAGGISAYLASTHQIERQITADVRGTIISVDENRRGSPRLLISPARIEGIADDRLPIKIRLSTTSKHIKYTPGLEVHGLARLYPVSGPVYPGSYDFSFFGWFYGLGGSGFFMGKPDLTPSRSNQGFRDQFLVSINKLREKIKARVERALPGSGGDVAVALITGDKTRIPQEVQQSLRNTGLAHILAISGLHMALVTLTVIWIVRLTAACLPNLSLYYPIKKWAVCIGFITATSYLLLSGMGIATQRAWIMISVMLLAVLLDRKAITIRSVAVSAALILLFNPQNLFSPGFQMSFAAVASLVAGYELLRKRKSDHADELLSTRHNGWIWSMVKLPLGYLSGIATTSLIAGAATSFVAAWHFHQIAPLGLLANVLAMPIVGLIIMPFALLSIILMPYSLEFLPLILVDFGIGLVIDISIWVEQLLPRGVTGTLPGFTLALFGVSLAILTLFRTRIRYISLLSIPLGLLFWQSPQTPDILVSENGKAIAFLDGQGEYRALYPRRNKFVSDIWSKAWGNGNIKPIDTTRDQCNSERCIVVLPSSLVMHIVYNPDFLRSSCGRADILIAPRLRWVHCNGRIPTLILKRFDFEKRGSKAIIIGDRPNNGRHQITVHDGLPDLDRPWSRTVRPIDEINDIAG
ncbi:MAG: ComEC/Rec2 family competence protein [Pseudomonadota bacterium]